jgi:hypothetical protein
MIELTQYGLPGIVIAGLSWFVLYLIKEHKKERDEWKQTTERQFDHANESNKETRSLLSEIKTILHKR